MLCGTGYDEYIEPIRSNGGNKMEIKVIPYTDRYPYIYQIYIRGYIIQTTNKDTHEKIVDLFNKNPEYQNSYASIPYAHKIRIECNATVRIMPGI